MTLTLELTTEETKRLEALAAGKSVDAFLHDLVRNALNTWETTARPRYELLSVTEWDEELDRLGEEINPKLPPLSDEALTRESLYPDRRV